MVGGDTVGVAVGTSVSAAVVTRHPRFYGVNTMRKDADGTLLGFRPRTWVGRRIFSICRYALDVGVVAKTAPYHHVQVLVNSPGNGKREREGIVRRIDGTAPVGHHFYAERYGGDVDDGITAAHCHRLILTVDVCVGGTQTEGVIPATDKPLTHVDAFGKSLLIVVAADNACRAYTSPRLLVVGATLDDDRTVAVHVHLFGSGGNDMNSTHPDGHKEVAAVTDDILRCTALIYIKTAHVAVLLYC